MTIKGTLINDVTQSRERSEDLCYGKIYVVGVTKMRPGLNPTKKSQFWKFRQKSENFETSNFFTRIIWKISQPHFWCSLKGQISEHFPKNILTCAHVKERWSFLHGSWEGVKFRSKLGSHLKMVHKLLKHNTQDNTVGTRKQRGSKYRIFKIQNIYKF